MIGYPRPSSFCLQLLSIFDSELASFRPTQLTSFPIGLLCSGCISLDALPAVPSSLKYLTVSGCKELQELPDISHTCMAELVCKDCFGLKVSIQQLKTLPITLTWLDLTGLKHGCSKYQ